jgi:hypothetical protein
MTGFKNCYKCALVICNISSYYSYFNYHDYSVFYVDYPTYREKGFQALLTAINSRLLNLYMYSDYYF